MTKDLTRHIIKLMNKFKKTIIIILITFLLAAATPMSTFASWPDPLDFTDEVWTISDAVYMAEANSGKVLYSKNPEMRVYPASTIKILTALIAVENASLNEMVNVSYEATRLPEGYTDLPLYAGERMSLEDCLYGMLVLSANDCAKAIAEHVGGTIRGFADMMNRKAKELGCKGSHFTNPYGEYDCDHYSTAYDMYLISRAAFANTQVRKIANTHSCMLDATNASGARYITSKNYLNDPASGYYNEYVTASKTGYLDTGRCMVTLSEHGNADVITICMHSSAYLGVFDDTDSLISYAQKNVDLDRLGRNAPFPGELDITKQFSDVADASASYYKPIYWAVRENFIVGYKDNTFRPQANCTRAQFTVMLWRWAGRPEPSSYEGSFSDINESMSSYKAIMWAASEDIVRGYKDGRFGPSDNLTRSQIVVMLWRALGRPHASANVPFADINSSHSAFSAVSWAEKNNIVKGYADGRFGVNDFCTRSQIVTILYRACRMGYLY